MSADQIVSSALPILQFPTVVHRELLSQPELDIVTRVTLSNVSARMAQTISQAPKLDVKTVTLLGSENDIQIGAAESDRPSTFIKFPQLDMGSLIDKKFASEINRKNAVKAVKTLFELGIIREVHFYGEESNQFLDALNLVKATHIGPIKKLIIKDATVSNVVKLISIFDGVSLQEVVTEKDVDHSEAFDGILTSKSLKWHIGSPLKHNQLVQLCDQMAQIGFPSGWTLNFDGFNVLETMKKHTGLFHLPAGPGQPHHFFMKSSQLARLEFTEYYQAVNKYRYTLTAL